MSQNEHKIVHSTYKKNVSDIREAGKNFPVSSTEVEAPKDIFSNRTIPGYAAADIQVQQMTRFGQISRICCLIMENRSEI